jgi:hypothetical protein
MGDLNYLHPKLYKAAFTGVAGASGVTAAFVFDVPVLVAGTAFLAGADFFATFCRSGFLCGLPHLRPPGFLGGCDPLSDSTLRVASAFANA